MKSEREILDELMKESQQIVDIFFTHANNYKLPDSNFRALYATRFFFSSVESHEAVVVLTAKNLRGPALTLIRQLLESWVKGSWISLFPSDDRIKEISSSDVGWKPSMNELAREIKTIDEYSGQQIETQLEILKFLHGCVHVKNSYLDLHLNDQTKSITQNVPDNLMAVMLNQANLNAFLSALYMQQWHMMAPYKRVLHKLDEQICRPLYIKYTEYVYYSDNLLKDIYPKLFAGEPLRP